MLLFPFIYQSLSILVSVPAFVLEHHLAGGSGRACNILVTQPRRVSAIGVASRVAQEHCEDINNNPSLVGYAIRGERRASPNCRLLFCTTGVVLRRLSGGDPDLEGVSHVFVDEVCFYVRDWWEVALFNPRVRYTNVLSTRTFSFLSFESFSDGTRASKSSWCVSGRSRWEGQMADRAQRCPPRLMPTCSLVTLVAPRP
jgi:hypothetical protein